MIFFKERSTGTVWHRHFFSLSWHNSLYFTDSFVVDIFLYTTVQHTYISPSPPIPSFQFSLCYLDT